MNTENKIVGIFIDEIYNLYYEYNELFDKSYKKKLVKANVELIKDRRYAIADDIWNINDKENHNFLYSLLELIEENTPEYLRDINLFREIFKDSVSDSSKFMLNILTNKQNDLVKFSQKNEISIDFLTFFSIFSAYKYRNRIKEAIEKEYDLESHISGICPVCGHWPGMAYIVGDKGTRWMSCICCGANWKFNRIRCSFCLTSDKELLGYLNVEGEEEVSGYTCESCRRYLKTIKIDMELVDFSNGKPIIDYLNSGFIDIAAMQNKYVQESVLGTRFTGPNDEHYDFYRDLMIND